MIQKVIDEFLNQSEKVADYRQAVNLLRRSGFFDFVRKFGYADIIDQGNNPYAMATEAARSHGFQRAVTIMEYFYEEFALKQEVKKSVPTFGADKTVIKEKYLTEEELNKLKGGTI